MQKYNLSIEQIFWRSWKKKELLDKFPQEYPVNDVEVFLSSGRPVFDNHILHRRLSEIALRQPLETAENEMLKIWKKPVKNREYVAGADTAEGVPGGDYSCLVIINKENCEEVAELHGHIKPVIFARKCAEICAIYNNAYLGVERNNHGHTVLNVLKEDIDYPNLFCHTDLFQTTSSRQITGWLTNTKTKPIMIDELAHSIAEGSFIIHDPEFIRECLNYAYDDTGSTAAILGSNDDRVIARAIAIQVRKCQPFEVKWFSQEDFFAGRLDENFNLKKAQTDEDYDYRYDEEWKKVPPRKIVRDKTYRNDK